ncbi:MAG: rhodanese-like domain-containing protein [Caldimicrobium sp.]
MKKKEITKLGLIGGLIGGAFLISQGLSSQDTPQFPTIHKSCALSGCHSPAPSEFRGNTFSVSGKAEIIQIDTGKIIEVKFDDNTKVVNWNQPLNKLGRGTPIKIVYTQRDGKYYATLVAVKPPMSVPPHQRVSLEEMKRIWANKEGLIVDARPAPKYAEGHIPGAINIFMAEMEKHLDKLPKDKNALIVFYCEGPR